MPAEAASDNDLSPSLAAQAARSRVTYGSCLCGDVRYRISGVPLRLIHGQPEAGSSAPTARLASPVFVPARQFRWTHGESQVVSYRLPGPGSMATAFCRRCGGDLPRASRGESVVVVPRFEEAPSAA